MTDVEVLPPEEPRAMTGTEQLLMVGARLAESLVERLRAPPADAPDGDAGAPVAADGELERLRRALAHARRLNSRLALALGACRCFGARGACPECGGQGRAGFYPIDPGAFTAFVAPAVAADPETFLGILGVNAELARSEPQT
jgi:hypothetical protein